MSFSPCDILVTIYRVEDKYGNGPYTRVHNSELREKMMDAHQRNGFRSRPPPYRDGIGDVSYGYSCATKDMASLRQWFRGFLRGILREGYQVVSYDVPEKHIRYGNQQLIFEWDKKTNKRVILTSPNVGKARITLISATVKL